MAKAKGKSVPANASASSNDAVVNVAAAKTWREAMDNILLDVAKSAHKAVTDGTEFLIKSMQQNAHNWFACGERLLKIAGTVNERQFSRLINEVWSRFGLSKPTAYRWMGNAEALTKAVPYEPARDALLTVSNGNGLISRKDGVVSLTGGYAAGLRKHTVPAIGSYEVCLDWAREVQLIAEKADGETGMTIADIFKSARGKFAVLLNGNRKFNANLATAVEFVVICYRDLEAKSQPIAMATLEAIEDSSITPNAAGKNAVAALRAVAEGKDKGTVLRHHTTDTPAAKTA